MRDYYDVNVESDNGRAEFEKSGLKYEDLTWIDMTTLAAFIQIELLEYAKTVKYPIILKAFPAKMTKAQLKKANWKGVEIQGTYFSNREAVSFYDNGRVGFCIEMSGYNRIPIFQGFYKWLKTKRVEGDTQ